MGGRGLLTVLQNELPACSLCTPSIDRSLSLSLRGDVVELAAISGTTHVTSAKTGAGK